MDDVRFEYNDSIDGIHYIGLKAVRSAGICDTEFMDGRSV